MRELLRRLVQRMVERTMTLRIEPYGLHSKGAKTLALHTGVLRATHKQVRKHGTFDTIINWGNSERRFPNATYINDPEAVAIASNKLLTARAFAASGVFQPAYTEDKNEARTWLDDGHRVVARRLLRASQGRGIDLCELQRRRAREESTGADDGDAGNREGDGELTNGTGRDGRDGRPALVDAPLYTMYMKKADEYRIHVFDSEVIDIQQKRKRQEVPNELVNYQIRNAHNGWVYCRDGADPPRCVIDAAIDAVCSLGLDFGAADIGYNRHNETAFVFEVNTAPGLEGSTIGFYARAIQRKLPFTQSGAYQRRRRESTRDVGYGERDDFSSTEQRRRQC